MIERSYRCDTVGCDKYHTATNNWWVVTRLSHGYLLQTWEKADESGNINNPTTGHFCGQAHAIQYLSSLMEKK